MPQTRITGKSFTAADLHQARSGVTRALDVQTAAILAARVEGWSWRRIGAIVGEHGETLRRRYGETGDDGLPVTVPPEA